MIKKVRVNFQLNKRYAEDAVLQAQAIISSQKELLSFHMEGVQGKIQKTKQKMEDYQTGRKTPMKVSLDVCLSSLQSRLDRLLKKEQDLLQHQENGTIPTVIFGGKKNFFNRLKNKISKEEWRDVRSNTLYSRGDRTKKGNLNTRIVFDNKEQQFYLEVANPLLLEEGKRNNPRLRFTLGIPDKYFDEIVNVVMPDVIGSNDKGKPIEDFNVYSVELKRKNKKYYVHITYELETFGSELKWNGKVTSDLVAGIDVNIDRVAVSVLTKQGNLIESKTFYCHELEYVKSNRRTNITGEIAKEVIDYLLQMNVGSIVLEDIKLKQDHDTNKRFNRLVHSFAKTKLQNALIARGLKYGFNIKKVNPAYTSVIGRYKYSKTYGLSTHEAASFVIGRRGLYLDEKIPRELLEQLRSLVKPKLIQTLGSMEESERKSASGKQRQRYLGILLKNINGFKENHSWKLWNVVHKTLVINNQGLQLREV